MTSIIQIKTSAASSQQANARAGQPRTGKLDKPKTSGQQK
jgi:hypothetical protein